jgi:hypothetical protein
LILLFIGPDVWLGRHRCRIPQALFEAWARYTKWDRGVAALHDVLLAAHSRNIEGLRINYNVFLSDSFATRFEQQAKAWKLARHAASAGLVFKKHTITLPYPNRFTKSTTKAAFDAMQAHIVTIYDRYVEFEREDEAEFKRVSEWNIRVA